MVSATEPLPVMQYPCGEACQKVCSISLRFQNSPYCRNREDNLISNFVRWVHRPIQTCTAPLSDQPQGNCAALLRTLLARVAADMRNLALVSFLTYACLEKLAGDLCRASPGRIRCCSIMAIPTLFANVPIAIGKLLLMCPDWFS
jgi:hypothetical protein